MSFKDSFNLYHSLTRFSFFNNQKKVVIKERKEGMEWVKEMEKPERREQIVRKDANNVDGT